jgi:FkbM family methyltransferase
MPAPAKPQPEPATARPLGILRDRGFTPGAIIDIGVGAGTGGLYDVWGPQVPVALIEPSRNALPYMERIQAERGAVLIFNCGASDRSGVMEATEDKVRPYVAFGGRKPKWPPVEVPVRTCDEIVREAGLEGPFVYKLDTDSHDWEALQGSDRTLSQTAVVIVEMNIFNAFRGMASPDQVWRFLVDRGFALFDIGSQNHADNGTLRGIDLIFAKADLPAVRSAYENAAKAPSLVLFNR